MLHPRLLQSLVLIEPPMAPIGITKGGLGTVKASTFRKDLWPSRETARTAMLQKPYYRRWDPRVFNRWIEHGLRDTPTTLHPQPGAVTLTTTKSQEIATYLRPLYEIQRDASGTCRPDKLAYPDLNPTELAPDTVGYNPRRGFRVAESTDIATDGTLYCGWREPLGDVGAAGAETGADRHGGWGQWRSRSWGDRPCHYSQWRTSPADGDGRAYCGGCCRVVRTTGAVGVAYGRGVPETLGQSHRGGEVDAG